MATILIVDDETNILSALRRVFRSEGHELVLCSDPLKALEHVAATPFDLVLSDYRMPGMDGVALLVRIKLKQPDCARLILSGQTDRDGLMDAINRAQIHRFIAKPWDDYELRMTVQHTLEQQEVVVENRRLAELVRAQQRELNSQKKLLLKLEAEHPGISDLSQDPMGAFVLEE